MYTDTIDRGKNDTRRQLLWRVSAVKPGKKYALVYGRK